MPFSGAASTYHSCGDWSNQNQSRCENSQVKSQNNNPSGTVGLTDNFRLWNSSSLFTFAISFDWYSSESLLQWWSYELLNLLSRQMLLFFRESFLKLLKKVTFKSLFLYKLKLIIYLVEYLSPFYQIFSHQTFNNGWNSEVCKVKCKGISQLLEGFEY